MTYNSYNSEGLADGQVMTTSVQGGIPSGTAFDQVAKSGAVTVIGSASAARRGSRGLRVVAADTDSLILVKNFPAGVRALAGSHIIDLDAAQTSAASQLVQVRNSAGPRFVLQLQAQNRLAVLTGSTVLRTFTVALPTKASAPGASTVRLDWWLRIDPTAPSATNGSAQVAYFIGKDNTTAAETAYAATNIDLGTTDITSLRFGKISTVAGSAQSMDLDTFAWDDGAAGRFATPAQEVVVNQPPTATLTVDAAIVEPGQTFTLTLADADVDGTVAVRTLRQVSGPSVPVAGTGTTRTGTAPYTLAGASLVYGYQVVDDDGAASVEAVVAVTVLAASERLVTVGGPGPVEVPLRTVWVTEADVVPADTSGYPATYTAAYTGGGPSGAPADTYADAYGGNY